MVGPAPGQREDSGSCEPHPEQVERAPRAGDRDGQGPDELERDRDPERDPVQRL